MSATGPRLVWEKGDGSKVEFPLTGAIHLVGREEPADIQVSEPLVSRSHARLERRGEAWVLLDLGSTNFTRVNGNRIGEAELQDGTRCALGEHGARFATEAEAQTRPTADPRSRPEPR